MQNIVGQVQPVGERLTLADMGIQKSAAQIQLAAGQLDLAQGRAWPLSVINDRASNNVSHRKLVMISHCLARGCAGSCSTSSDGYR